MYSVVLATMLSVGGEAPTWGRGCWGCHGCWGGCYSCSCFGGWGCHGWWGGWGCSCSCFGVYSFGCNGCSGWTCWGCSGCWGCYSSWCSGCYCSGVVYSPVVVSSCYGCYGAAGYRPAAGGGGPRV